MRRSFHGPFLRYLIKSSENKRIVGVATKDEVEVICQKVAQSIANATSNKTEKEIYDKLINRFKVVCTENLNADNSTGGFAISYRNEIYIDYFDFESIINSDIEELFDSQEYDAIVHECIHILQRLFEKDDIERYEGFVEGATEWMANRATLRRRSSSNLYDELLNFPQISTYVYEVLIMEQFAIIFGTDVVEKFALDSDQVLLDKIKELLGDTLFESLRNDMNNNNEGALCSWQDIILEKYFNNEFGNIDSKEKAEAYLRKLKQMDYARMRRKDDTTFKDYYIQKLVALSEQYPNLDTQTYAYSEPEFYPPIYEDEYEKTLDNISFRTICTNVGLPKNSEELKALNLDRFKRHSLIKNGHIFEAITLDGNPVALAIVYPNGRIADIDIHKKRWRICLTLGTICCWAYYIWTK